MIDRKKGMALLIVMEQQRRAKAKKAAAKKASAKKATSPKKP